MKTVTSERYNTHTPSHSVKYIILKRMNNNNRILHDDNTKKNDTEQTST